jgi:uncharacterized protein (DUF362 family)
MAPELAGLTRREVLAGMLGTAAAATLGTRVLGAEAPVRVVRVESADVWKGEARRPEVVAAMVNAGIIALTGDAKADVAWKRFFKPGQRVGLKLNLLGRPLVYTSREMVDAVVEGALVAGVKPGDITVWDRKAEHFENTVYTPGTGRLGERVKIGANYAEQETAPTSGGPVPIDRIPLEETDITVNLPVIKDHGGSGTTGALKNIAFGCYRNHRQAHSGNCDPYITETYRHFVSKLKIPLIVMDATEGCFDGGPGPQNSSTVWREHAIYLATDPVALDYIERGVIDAKRKSVGLPETLRRARHIESAAAAGLGVADPDRITLVTIKV